MDKLPGMVVRLHRSAEGRWSVPYASTAFIGLCGIGLPALRRDARPLADVVHPEDLRRLALLGAQHTPPPQPIKELVRIRQQHGQWVHLEASAMVDRAADGGLHLNVFLTDAAPQPVVDTELQRQHSRWQRATAAADIGVLEISLLTGSLQLDAVACRLQGLDPAQPRLAFESWLERVAEADRPAARSLLAKPAIPDEVTRLLLSVEAGDAHGPRTLEFVLQAVADERRRVGICTDVTQRQTLDALKRDKLDAEKASRSKSEFMSRVSHELRTPLNGILGFAQLMALDSEHPLAPAQSQRLDVLRQSGSRLLSLIDQLLEVSRIEQGRLRLRNRPIDVRLLVERCAVELMPLAQQRGIELLVQIPLTSGPVRADPDALEQVVTNLLSNAIKYNRPKGRVRVRFEVADQGVLTVDDTGIGMSEEQLNKLFEPFNRLGAERTETQGSGLGLVITRKLVRAMGGRIDVLSRPGRGSRFAVSLPLAKAGRPKPPDVQTPPEATSVWDNGVEQVVLYVEDDEVNTILMEQIFRSQPNWRLLTAATGPEGLEIAQEHDLSLVLLDLNLPGLSGFEVMERLKAHEHTRHLRCIALSADALPHQIQQALSLGFDDYWTKPIDVATVIGKLKDEFRLLSEVA
ncbi:MAG: ATP-binding protein [Pseudomonadota bacterium]|nr:ATP-binding protein [Pseudomonadota bacterium]